MRVRFPLAVSGFVRPCCQMASATSENAGTQTGHGMKLGHSSTDLIHLYDLEKTVGQAALFK